MAANNPTPQENQEPFIPPGLLLGLAALGLIVALVVAFTQPTFGVVGYGGLALAIASLVLWVMLSPQQAVGILTGRTARFGGTSVIVTLVVIAALVAIYTFVRGQNIRVDLTQRDTFSLTAESQEAIEGIGADPTIPPIQLIAFYGAAQAGFRDQSELLFDSYAQASNGKITYQFVDPDRSPQIAERYAITRNGQIVVVANGEDGQPDVENAEQISAADQGLLTNAILKVAAQGEFNAYFLTVENNVSNQMTAVKTTLTTRYDWNVRDVSLIALTSPQGEFRLNDPNIDGDVVVIPGGSEPLTDQELQILTDYMNNGGSLIIFAGSNLNPDQSSLATADNLNNYLSENFGIRINRDLILDQTQAFQTELQPFATSLDSSSFITNNGINRTQAAVIFPITHSISVNDVLPANVTVTELIRSSSEAYAKTDLTPIIENQDPAASQQLFAPAEGDPRGPFVLAASAENAATGARVVVFGSEVVAIDQFTQLDVANLNVAFNSLIWSTNFNDFFGTINVEQQQRPEDTPVFAEATELRTINFVTIILLPFGVLAIGVLVWWSNRERARTR